MNEVSPEASAKPYPFHQACRLGLLLSNAWPDIDSRIGTTISYVERALEAFPEAKSIQVPGIKDPGEARQLKSIIEEQGVRLNITLNRVQDSEGIDLTSRDQTGRYQAAKQLRPHFEMAQACGAEAVTVFPGANVEDSDERLVQLGCLEGSLAEVAEAARNLGGLKVLIESMDIHSDKKRLLGLTLEAIAMAARLKQQELPFGLIADTAHLFLNEERVVDCIQMHDMFMDELHFCNAITTRGHPLAGDKHPPLGEPGFLTIEWLSDCFTELRRFNLFQPNSELVVAAEVRSQDGENGLDTLRQGIETLQTAWNQSFKTVTPPSRNPLDDDEPLFPPDDQ